MTKFEAAFEKFKERKTLVFSDSNVLREFLDFLQTKSYTPTQYARELATDLENGFQSLVGIEKHEKYAWGISIKEFVKETDRYYVDIEDVDVMELLTQ